MGDEHDKPNDEKTLGDYQRPDGSADRQGTDIAPEYPERVVFEEELDQQGACKADKEECIENISEQERLEKERKEKDSERAGASPLNPECMLTRFATTGT